MMTTTTGTGAGTPATSPAEPIETIIIVRDFTPAGIRASRARANAGKAKTMPMGLPSARPKVTPKKTKRPSPERETAPRGTPAFAKAKSGMTTNATLPCS